MRANNKTLYDADRAAALIARSILKAQLQISTFLNYRFNAYSVRQKKIVLLLFGIFISLFIAADLWRPFLSLPEISRNYNSAHIGQASDVPFSKLNKRQLTDSLTKKIQSWK